MGPNGAERLYLLNRGSDYLLESAPSNEDCKGCAGGATRLPEVVYDSQCHIKVELVPASVPITGRIVDRE